MTSQFMDRPIPGQSLTTTPKNAQYEQPPQINDPEKALNFHLGNLSKPKSMEDILEFVDQGVTIRALVEGVLRGGVMNGIHSIDISLIIAPVIHEFVRGIPLAAGMEFVDGFDEDEDIDEAMYRMKKPEVEEEEEPVEEPTVQEMPMKEEKPSGLMARV
jgi:hypothetical protein|tara:strand:+ start:3602 stop:4078 length:477 start_codon:yes stop_codon:yes gene_type:complete